MSSTRKKYNAAAVYGICANMAGYIFCVVMLLICFYPELVHAAPPPPLCTDTPGETFILPPAASGEGILSTVVGHIITVLNSIAFNLFEALKGSLTGVIQILLSVYIIIYGILFTFGMVQFTLYDFAMRMIKFGIIILLISPGAWTFFNTYVVQFFNDGTNALINQFTAIAVGGVTAPYNPAIPFAVLDDVVSKAFSAKMAIQLLGSLVTGPYGPIVALMMGFGLARLMAALLEALWIYLMSLVLKTLFFGLAPIFLSCLLFDRTRHLFDGWLNQIINASLQPIMLFAFFTFFIKLIEATIDNIFVNELCWTKLADSMRGSATHMYFWRYKLGGNPYNGSWNFSGPDAATIGAPAFPVDIVTILVFLLLVELAIHFNSIVLQLASEFSSVALNLGSLKGMGSQGKAMAPGSGGDSDSILSKVSNRVNPGVGRGKGPTKVNKSKSGASSELVDKYRDMVNRRD